MIDDDVTREFHGFPRPGSVLRDKEGAYSVEEQAIQADFGHLEREALDEEQVGMMVCDAALLSDHAILYFLPQLVPAIRRSGSNLHAFANRLDQVRTELLSASQRAVLASLISDLRSLDDALDRECATGF